MYVFCLIGSRVCILYQAQMYSLTCVCLGGRYTDGTKPASFREAGEIISPAVDGSVDVTQPEKDQ